MTNSVPPGFENLVTGVTSILPGDLVRHPVTEPVIIQQDPVLCTEMKIWLPGEPIGKPRMTQRDKWAKRPCVMRYRAWADRLRAVAGQFGAGPLPPAEAVVSLSWLAQFEPPKSWSKKKRAAMIGELHRSNPDASNILKGVEDILYPNGDSALAVGSYRKIWHWKAGIEIRIIYQVEE
jgi:hypothetical protein